MKNYVAKLRENEEKGFSLVELIIVMAIMAILVGVVASQVIPYMEKSRQSKDQQQLSSLCTDIVSAISQADTDPGNIVATELSNAGNSAGSWGKVLEGLRSADGTTDKSLADIESGVTGKLKSKLAGTSPKIYVKRDNGVVTVFVADSNGESVGGKLEVKSE